MQLGCAWNGNDPGLLREQPCQSDLGRRCLLLLRESANHVHDSLIGIPILGRKTRNDIAEISLVELRVFADRPGEKAFSERTEGDEADAEFLKNGDGFGLGLPPPQGVFTLKGGHGLHCMGAANGLYTSFRKS